MPRETSMGDLWDFGTVRNVRNGTIRSVRGMNSTSKRFDVGPTRADQMEGARQQGARAPPVPEKAGGGGLPAVSASISQDGCPPRSNGSRQHADPTEFVESTIRQAPVAQRPQHSVQSNYVHQGQEAMVSRQHLSETSVHAPRQPPYEPTPAEAGDEDSEEILNSVVLPVLDQASDASISICPFSLC